MSRITYPHRRRSAMERLSPTYRTATAAAAYIAGGAIGLALSLLLAVAR